MLGRLFRSFSRRGPGFARGFRLVFRRALWSRFGDSLGLRRRSGLRNRLLRLRRRRRHRDVLFLEFRRLNYGGPAWRGLVSRLRRRVRGRLAFLRPGRPGIGGYVDRRPRTRRKEKTACEDGSQKSGPEPFRFVRSKRAYDGMDSHCQGFLIHVVIDGGIATVPVFARNPAAGQQADATRRRKRATEWKGRAEKTTLSVTAARSGIRGFFSSFGFPAHNQPLPACSGVRHRIFPPTNGKLSPFQHPVELNILFPVVNSAIVIRHIVV